MQMGSSSSTASMTTVFVTHFGNAITEAVYPNVPDSTPLKNDGQTVPTPLPPKGGPKA